MEKYNILNFIIIRRIRRNFQFKSLKKSLFFFSHIQNVQSSLFEIIKDHITVLAGTACTLFSGDLCNKATGTSAFDFQVNPSTDNNPEKLTDIIAEELSAHSP